MADPTAKASCEVIAALCEEEEAIAVYSASTGAAQAQVFRGSASARTALVSLHDRYLLAPHRTKPAITVSGRSAISEYSAWRYSMLGGDGFIF